MIIVINQAIGGVCAIRQAKRKKGGVAKSSSHLPRRGRGVGGKNNKGRTLSLNKSEPVQDIQSRDGDGTPGTDRKEE